MLIVRKGQISWVATILDVRGTLCISESNCARVCRLAAYTDFKEALASLKRKIFSGAK